MKRHWVIAAVAAAMLLGLGIWYQTYRSSPAYSLAQIRGAIEEGNRLRFQQYVDLDRFLTEAMDQLIGQTAIERPTDDDATGFGALGAALGRALADQMKPAMVQGLRGAVLDGVESGRFSEAFAEDEADSDESIPIGLADLGGSTGATPQAFEGIGTITREGDVALAEMRFRHVQLDTTLALQLRMERVDRHWLVVAPENLDSYIRRVETLRNRRLIEINSERREEVFSYLRLGMPERQRERLLSAEVIDILVPVRNVSDTPVHLLLGWLVPSDRSGADREVLLSEVDRLAPQDSTVLKATLIHGMSGDVPPVYRLDDPAGLDIEIALIAGDEETVKYVGPFANWEQYMAWLADPQAWGEDLRTARAERGDSGLDDLLGRSTLGPWSLNERTDPLDDSPIVTLINVAESGRSRFGDRPTLILRCQNNRTEVFINWDEYLGTSSPTVSYRVGDGEMRQSRWSLSTTNRATFFPGSHIGLIQELAVASQFVARVTPSRQSPITAVFDLTGLNEHIGTLREACNWA